MNHFTRERVTDIIESSQISHEELEHVAHCENCNSWLRAFVVVVSADRKEADLSRSAKKQRGAA